MPPFEEFFEIQLQKLKEFLKTTPLPLLAKNLSIVL